MHRQLQSWKLDVNVKNIERLKQYKCSEEHYERWKHSAGPCESDVSSLDDDFVDHVDVSIRALNVSSDNLRHHTIVVQVNRLFCKIDKY